MKVYNHIKIGFLFSVLLSLFCFSCNNFFQPPMPEKATEGKGYVSLSIDGVQVGRTILPKATAADFKNYRLVFAPVDGDEFTVDRAPADLAQPIILDAGKYTLKVYAYRDTDRQKLAAEGETELEIIPDMTTPKTLILKVKEEATGTGTFSWVITYADGIEAKVVEAVMTITYFNPNGGEEPANGSPINLIDKKSGSTPLDAGYYRVVIKLTKTGGQETAELREILYISPSMKSPLEYEFTDKDFTKAIFVTNGGDAGNGSLRWAIGEAVQRQNSTIIIDSSVVKTITLSSSLQIMQDYYYAGDTINLTIEGNGVIITKDSSENFSLLYTEPSFIVTIRRIHFKNGKASYGGAIFTGTGETILTLESCIFSGNQAEVAGGAISNGGTMFIKGCTFYGNSAAQEGGAILNFEASLALTGNLFYGNTAPAYPVVPVSRSEVISRGYNVVDVPFDDAYCNLSLEKGDRYTSNPTVTQGTFKPIYGKGAAGALTNLPAIYPTADFYGYSIAAGGAAGAIQEKANACIVTFSTGYAGIKISPVAVEWGETIEKPGDPVRYDNTFNGWYTNSTYAGSAWNFDTDKAPNASALTLYAKWQKETPTYSNLAEQLAEFLTNAQSGDSTVITVDGGYITPLELNSSVPVTITLKSADKDHIKTISLDDKGSMFTVRENVTLKLENITLQGHKYNTAPLVYVSWGGALIMEDGSTITGNTYNNFEYYGVEYYGAGGGVSVSAGSTFTMNGGTISGNEAYYGGGVSVYGGGGDSPIWGTFEMKGNARISGNIANNGGGVYVSYSGSFIMDGGTISGNEATGEGADDGGGGVWLNTSGEFRITNGTVYGNETEIEESLRNIAKKGAAILTGSIAINNTIKHVDGVRTFDVATESQWTVACSQISNGGNGNIYLINVTDSFEIAGTSSYTFGAVNYINVTIKGKNGATIRLKNDTNGSLLRINTRQTVTIEELDLRGKGVNPGDQTNNTSLVFISSGIFNMNGGTIGNNKYDGSGNLSGGGVSVVSSGEFTMNGGTIGNNEININGGVAYGGGVYVSGTFTMNGGTISNNRINTSSAVCNGSGVYVDTGGTFTMDQANIIDNTINITSSGYGSGGGVYVSETTGSDTIFNMKSGYISGNTISGGNTNRGGGVYVGNNGKFQIETGTVYGTDESSRKNTATDGAALKLDGGTAQYGTFTGTGGSFEPNWATGSVLSTDDKTINILNGEPKL